VQTGDGKERLYCTFVYGYNNREGRQGLGDYLRRPGVQTTP